MKTFAIALLLCAVNLFGQEIKLVQLPYYEKLSDETVVNYYEPNEALRLSDTGVTIKFNVAQSEKNGTYINSAFVFVGHENLLTKYILFITKTDTAYFSSINTLKMFGEDILIPVANGMLILKKDPITKIIIVPRDENKSDMYFIPMQPNYFQRFLPLLSYYVTK